MHDALPDELADEVLFSTISAEEQTLRARARFYPVRAPSDEQDEALAGDPILLCRLHDERYALDLALLRAVQAARGLTPLPCTPPYVAGILNVRGTVVAVLDLAQCLGLGSTAPGRASRSS